MYLCVHKGMPPAKKSENALYILYQSISLHEDALSYLAVTTDCGCLY